MSSPAQRLRRCPAWPPPARRAQIRQTAGVGGSFAKKASPAARTRDPPTTHRRDPSPRPFGENPRRDPFDDPRRPPTSQRPPTTLGRPPDEPPTTSQRSPDDRLVTSHLPRRPPDDRPTIPRGPLCHSAFWQFCRFKNSNRTSAFLSFGILEIRTFCISACLSFGSRQF